MARLLLDLFTRFGTIGPRGIEFPADLSQEALGDALGLTRRSVFRDVNALDDFGAIDHDRSGRLTLIDPRRLRRIARLGCREEHEAAMWAEDIRAALTEADWILARDLAAEALAQLPRNETLGALAVTAALRAGDLDAAKQWLAEFHFTAEDAKPDVAALIPEIIAEEAMLAADERGAQALLRRAVAIHDALYRRSATHHCGIGLASLLVLAGRTADGRALAGRLLRAIDPDAQDCGALLIRGQAAAIAGRPGEARGEFCRAAAMPGADLGAMAVIGRRLGRVARVLGQDWHDLIATLSPRPVLFLAALPSRGECQPATADVPAAAMAALGGRDPWLAHVVLSSHREIPILAAASDAGMPVALVLPQPLDRFLREALRAGGAEAAAQLRRCVAASISCSVSDEAATATAAASLRQSLRHGLGLAIMQARQREATCLLINIADPAEPRPLFVPGGSFDPGNMPDDLRPDSLSEGFLAVVAIDPAGKTGAETILTRQPFSRGCGGAPVRTGRQLLYGFATIAEAVRFAFAAVTWSKAAGESLRVCCDIAAARGDDLASTRLSRLRPAAAENKVSATEIFAAECALFTDPPVHIRYFGRARSLDRRRRLTLWSLLPRRKAPVIAPLPPFSPAECRDAFARGKPVPAMPCRPLGLPA